VAAGPLRRDLIAWDGTAFGPANTTRRSRTPAGRKFDPKQGLAGLARVWTYEQKVMYQEAISALEKATGGSRNSSVAHALSLAGQQEPAQDILTRMPEKAKRKYVSAYDPSWYTRPLGTRIDADKAMEWPNKAFEEHSGFLVFSIPFEIVATRPRFQNLLRRMGFANQKAFHVSSRDRTHARGRVSTQYIRLF
jgi:hypothetical protein